GLREQFADRFQGKEAHVATVEQAAIAIVPSAAQQSPDYIEVLHVGDAGDDAAGRGQGRGRLAQHAPGINDVFEKIGENDRVEGTGWKTFGLHVGSYDIVQHLPGNGSGLRNQFYTGNPVAALLEQPAEGAGAATDVKDALCLRWNETGDFGAG